MRIIERILVSINYIIRRKEIFFRNLSLLKLWNALKCIRAYVLGTKKVKAYPVILKIDVTPYCHLRCPICIHSNSAVINQQPLNKRMQMQLPVFKKLVNEIAGKTWILSLQHLGEPLFNKNLAKMCFYANQKKINTFFVSNFSVKLQYSEIKDILQSGVNWITVALDGFSQSTYGKTRIGGSFNLVKRNLKSMLEIRRELNQKEPFIEVQSLIFKHNRHEKQKIIEYCNTLGVDKLTFKKGSIEPWIKKPKVNKPQVRKKKRLPLCFWPYLSGVVLYDGNIIPCCWHRHDNAYAEEKKRITMGSITKIRFKDIYNNQKYQELRSYCLKPGLLIKSQDAPEHYCYGCKRLFY